MRIITRKRLQEFWSRPKCRDAKGPLMQWHDDVRLAAWADPSDAKATFGKRVDFVKTRKSGTTVAVFDIGGNKYRLIAAIHYVHQRPLKGRVYVLKVMTHEEYYEDRWKDEF
jgi:mRNA interferase HigB